jgi:hypothetical protein
METARFSETRQTTNIYGVETQKDVYRKFTHLKNPKNSINFKYWSQKP